jgi:hypothetical protein
METPDIQWPEQAWPSFDGGGAKQKQSGAKRQPARATAGKLRLNVDRILRYIERSIRRERGR